MAARASGHHEETTSSGNFNVNIQANCLSPKEREVHDFPLDCIASCLEMWFPAWAMVLAPACEVLRET